MKDKESGMMELTGMIFRARHGVHWTEKIFRKRFRVDLKARFDMMPSAVSDRIGDTVDFAAVYRAVKEGMEMPADLMEKVAANIYSTVRNKFPELSGLEIKLSKSNPPVGGRMICSSVTISE